MSGDRSATAQWDYGVVQDSAQPKNYAAPSKPSWPSSHSPKTYGTQTAYNVPATVPHNPVWTHAPGQGHRPSFSKNHTSFPHHKWNPPANKVTGGVAYHKVYKQTQLEYSESNQQTEYGYWYYATENVAALTHQSGADNTVRGQFIDNGYLANTEDTKYRAINDAYPVFGFSKDLGSVGSSTQSTLFQISLLQENAVQFLGANGVQPVQSLWTSYFSNETQAVSYFYNDYQKASSLSSSLDDKIASDSTAAGGDDYLALTALATRQAFGALEFTNSPTEPWVFMKEISSDGNVNTVDGKYHHSHYVEQD